jgi:hypothetical protein
MEPLRPEVKSRILSDHPEAGPEIEEYERLIAERFATDPYAPSVSGAAMRSTGREMRERRIRELHQKYFVRR